MLKVLQLFNSVSVFVIYLYFCCFFFCINFYVEPHENNFLTGIKIFPYFLSGDP